MLSACFNVLRLGVTIQVRTVPEELHRQLKARAAMAGMSLRGYLLSEVGKVAEQPTLEAMWARLRTRPETHLPVSAADILRGERDGR